MGMGEIGGLWRAKGSGGGRNAPGSFLGAIAVGYLFWGPPPGLHGGTMTQLAHLGRLDRARQHSSSSSFGEDKEPGANWRLRFHRWMLDCRRRQQSVFPVAMCRSGPRVGDGW